MPRPPLPFESHYLDLDSLRYHYLDEGSGPPVLMLHGNPTWCYYYRHLVEALRGQYRCIAPDHVGCGFSDKPGDSRYDYTLEQRVDDVDRLTDALGLRENVTLVLHDWGGMIGMAWAARHPERVARLVLLNTAAFHLPETKRFPWPLWLARNTRLGAFLVRGFNAFSFAAAHVGCKRERLSREERRAFTAPYDSWDNRIATLRFVQDIPLRPTDRAYPLVTEVQDSLAQFRHTPTLICWGLRDFVFDRHFLAQWERRLPQAEVHRFPDCGHYILEDARAEVLPLIQDFLRRHPVDGGQA